MANWPIRVRALRLLCYNAFCLETTLSLTDLFIYLFINNMLKSFYLISVITLQTTTCRLLILLPGRTLGSHFTLLLIMFPCTMRDLNRYMLCTAIQVEHILNHHNLRLLICKFHQQEWVWQSPLFSTLYCA